MEDMNNAQLDRIEDVVKEILEVVKEERLPIADKWLTEPQVMKILNLSKRSMKRLRLSNKIRTSSATGKNFLYFRADVENYIYDNSVIAKRRRNQNKP
jgi:hypothetical protein